MSKLSDPITQATQAAWNLTAKKFAPEVDADVEFLKAGGMSLMEIEQAALSRLPKKGRAIHLQCSHGLDSLSLLNAGWAEVVGVDLSEKMLALAQAKSAALGSAASWVQADVLHPPQDLLGTADLVYTGKGALNWVRDITLWAEVVRSLLGPGGFLYIFEGHPLDWVWDPEADKHLLHESRSYFDRDPRPNEDFPARAVLRHVERGGKVPDAWEYHWTLAEIVMAVLRAGLDIQILEELPEHFWPRFNIEADEFVRVPHTFSLLGRLRAA